MSFATGLKDARIKKGLTQAQLGELIGVANTTISGYEKGTSEANEEKIRALMTVLEVDANTLFGWSDQKTLNILTPAGQRIGRAYEKAPPPVQRTVEVALEPYMDEASGPEPKMVSKIVYTFPAAAGIPLYADDGFEHIDFPESEVPKEADFGVRIQGDSMEPTIPDGSIVWVRKASEVREGRIGIFMVNDSATCKRFYKDENGIRLESDNSAHPPIIVHGYERFGVVGRVLEYR